MQLRFDPDHPKYEYITEASRAEEVLKLLEKEQILGVDIEGTGLDPYTSTLLLIQIGTPEISYVFDARTLKLGEIPLFKQILESNKVLKLLHNGKFDYAFIKVNTGVEVNNIFDTMLTEAVLTAGLVGKSASLQELSQKYLEVNLEKGTRKTFYNYTGKITEEQLKYSGLDTLTANSSLAILRSRPKG